MGRRSLAPTAGGMAVLLLLTLTTVLAAASVPTAGPLPPPPAAAPLSGVPIPARPLAAITLGVSGSTPAAVALNWTQTSSLTFSSYSVLFSATGASGPWASATVIPSQSTTTYAALGLTPGGTYWWEVAENDALLPTQYSNVVNATQPGLADLTYQSLSASDVQFNWTNSATYGGSLSFGSYALFEAVGSAAPTVAATVASVGTRSTTVTGLSPGTSYRFYLNTTDCAPTCGTGGSGTSVTRSNVVTLGTPLPLSVTVSASRTIVDIGQLDAFTCTPSGGRSPFTFAWDLGNGTFFSGPSSVSTSFPSAGPATVTCRVTDATPTQATSALTVSVAVPPEVTAAGTPLTLDLGQNVSFACAIQFGVAPYSVLWTFGDGQSAATLNATHLYGAPGPYVATCIVTDFTGTSASGHLSLSVSAALEVSLQANSSRAAPLASLTFSATPVNGSGVYVAFNFSFGDGAYSNGSSPAVPHAFAGTGLYSAEVSVTDTNGGVARGRLTVNISEITVTLGSPVTSVVRGTAVTFSADATGGAGGPYVYSWQFGDGVGATGPNVTHVYGTAGSYIPSLVVRDRLGSSQTIALAPVTVSAPTAAPLVSAGLVLVIGLAAALAAAAVGYLLYRREAERAYSRVAGRVPRAGPARLATGMRVCRACGRANLAMRTSCEACGAPLRGPR